MRRFDYVRCDGPNDADSLYDIIELRPGRSTRTMASRVRYAEMVEIIIALNSLRRE